MPKQIQAGRLTQALQRAFGFKGRYVPMLDEVIVPVYVIQDPLPATVTRLSIGTGSGVVTANGRAFVQLFNPLGSGVLVNLTKAIVLSDVKLEVNVKFNTEAAGASSGRHFRDRRNVATLGTPRAQLRLEGEGAATVPGDTVAVLQVDGALTQTAAWEVSNNDPRQPLAVLQPGNGVVIQERSGITGPYFIRATFQWLEVPITEVNPFGGIP